MVLMSGTPQHAHISRAHKKSAAAHLFMDMLTRLMMTLPSTRSALRADRRPSHLYARMVGSPARASPIEEYTGEREMESRRLTSRTEACTRHGGVKLVRWWLKLLAAGLCCRAGLTPFKQPLTALQHTLSKRLLICSACAATLSVAAHSQGLRQHAGAESSADREANDCDRSLLEQECAELRAWKYE